MTRRMIDLVVILWAAFAALMLLSVSVGLGWNAAQVLFHLVRLIIKE